MATLVHFPVSPWSEKARWALDHHGIRYRKIEHVPMIGEPLLRMWLRRPIGKVTVPALLAEEARLDDSLAIARWADDRGGNAPLFPRDRQPEIARYNALSDRILEAGRGRVTRRLRRSEAALLEAVPRPLRRLGKAATIMAAQGASHVLRKYGATKRSESEHLDILREGLEELRDERGGNRYLLGDFTYADIALAAALQGIEPVADRFIRLAPATREVWTEPELAEEFRDLLDWRDELYEMYR